jgi:hypothetical protein
VPEDLRAVGVTVGSAASGGLGVGDLPPDFADTEMNDVLCLRGEDVEGSVGRVLRAFRVAVIPGACVREWAGWLEVARRVRGCACGCCSCVEPCIVSFGGMCEPMCACSDVMVVCP